jgi:hypothetical protein
MDNTMKKILATRTKTGRLYTGSGWTNTYKWDFKSLEKTDYLGESVESYSIPVLIAGSSYQSDYAPGLFGGGGQDDAVKTFVILEDETKERFNYDLMDGYVLNGLKSFVMGLIDNGRSVETFHGFPEMENEIL